MSEPRRWKDSPDAPVGMRELLRAAKPHRPLDEATFHRGAGRVAKFSVAPAAGVAFGIWAKLAAAGAIGLAAASAVVVGARLEPLPMTAPSPASTPTSGLAVPGSIAPIAPVAPAGPVTTVEAPARADNEGAAAAGSGLAESPSLPPVRTRSVASRPPTTSAPTTSQAAQAAEPAQPITPTPAASVEAPVRAKSSLSDELALLESARRQITTTPALALLRLEEHRARYPAGLLATERDLLSLDALRRVGRVQDARDRARAWLARDPNGLHAARVRAIRDALE